MGFAPRKVLGGTLLKPISDDFNRANGALGSTSVGAEPWQIVSGTWSITSNMATSSTAASSRPIAVVEGRTANVDISINISSSGGGDALYFRVVDVNNWVRLRYYGWQTSSQSCSTCNTYYHEGSCSWIGYGANTGECNSLWCSGCPNCGSCGSDNCGCNNCSAWSNVCSTYSCNCVTNYYNNYRVYLDKFVAGSLTAITYWDTSASLIRAVASSNTVRVYTGTTDRGVFTVNEHTAATRHGMGRAESSYTGSALDNFSLTPLAA